MDNSQQRSTNLDFASFDDSDEMAQLINSVRKFSAQHLDSGSEDPQFSRDNFKRMADLGLTAMSLSEQAGGLDSKPLEIATALFEIARIDLGAAVYLSVHLMVSRLLESYGNSDYVRSLLGELASGKKLGAFCLTEAGAGSDAARLQCKAETDGGKEFILNGEKIYITSAGVADVYLVFARTGAAGAKGISAFVVERDNPGLSVGKPERKMGASGSPIGTVTLTDCKVKQEALLGKLGEGYKIALSGLNGGRVNIAACACGVGSMALEIAAAFAKERRAFEQRIADFQAIQFMIADGLMKLRASVLLTRDAAIGLARNSKDSLRAALAKCFASDSAVAITIDCVQVLGGAGYLKDYRVERLMRDAKMLQIVEGTNQIQRILIARALLTD